MRNLISFVLAVSFASLLVCPGNSDAAPKKMASKNSRLRGPVFLSPATATTNWTLPNICAAYNFPTGLTGGGVIGIAEFGGGYTQSDLTLFSETYMNGTPINISNVSINGGKNDPGVNPDDDAEVTLDIEIAAAAYYYCTGKAPTIIMFFAGGTNFLDDNAAIFASAVANGCDVLSISWLIDENFVVTSDATNLETAAISATSKGLAIFAAAGDGCATDQRDGETDGLNHVNLPASCPHVIAVGGTTKTTVNEIVWNNGFSLGTTYPLGTGGGYSTIFPVQSWQVGAPTAPSGNNGTGRMLPDVAANADPNTPYLIALFGSIQGAGNGTSAATPLWAGLNASFGKKLGFIAPTLWATANRKSFVDIVQGNNILFQAAVGPDPCTGVGVPIGTALATLFVPTTITPPPIVPSSVTASYSGGTLTITGDNNQNCLTLTQQSGKITIQSANGTKVNGTTSVSYSVSGNWNLSVSLNGGDDAISLIGVVVPSTNNPSIQLGAGNDRAALTLTNITNLQIDGGAGTNTLLQTSSTLKNLNATNFISTH